MDTRKHVELEPTVEGERWDQVSMRAYGTPYRAEDLIRANPGVAITPMLPGGLRLLAPVVEEVEVGGVLGGDSLPPWKR